MTLRLIEATFDDGYADSVLAALGDMDLTDIHLSPVNDSQQRLLRIVTDSSQAQLVTDSLQPLLGGSANWRLVIVPVEATIPPAKESSTSRPFREELYQDVVRGAGTDGNFVLLTFLAVIVAWIGLNESNVAVIIGAMVIAPLLGPNLALALGSALGDLFLIRRSVLSNVLGVGLTIAIATLLGAIWEPDFSSSEILSRTGVGTGDIVLALASGAAAALSMTTGLSATLVGVMVAIALMPPAVVLGLALGALNYSLAGGALLLLATNVVCLNIASQLILLWKGVRPRTWLERKAATTSVRVNLAIWTVLAAITLSVIYASTG